MSELMAVAARRPFPDRPAAGRALAAQLGAEGGADTVVVGLARGGVVVAAEVARVLSAPLEIVAVRKIGHPRQPEFGLGAVTPGDGVYVGQRTGLGEAEVARLVEETKAKAAALDARLHANQPQLSLRGKRAVLVDDGVATGSTMVAALRWARSAGAGRVVAAIPVGAPTTLELLEAEADAVVCLYALDPLVAVGIWYDRFPQVDDAEVVRLLTESRVEDRVGAPGIEPGTSRV